MWIQRIKVQRLSGKQRKKKEDQLIIDREFILKLNGIETSFICVPSTVKEMMIGFAFHTGAINSIDDITEIKIHENLVKIDTKPTLGEVKYGPLKSNYIIQAEKLYSKMYDFQDQALMFKESAITHSASFADEKELFYFSEDIERIQACYKAIGQFLNKKSVANNQWFLCSSKLDKPLVSTLLRLGIRHIISRVAPTNEAYQLANDSECTLIGFCRSQKCNLYCGAIN
ncbi:hypothetical protein DID80_06150 [Candidatus Marinamargulisbacteria bacterium SCGC AAA071-K20]|nr:hypothetical protein DID80_06150 [Candidatus Marinamargulisbacteria bacterium SCGC AAA071-K20]